MKINDEGLSIIIPSLNESENIRLIISQFKPLFKQYDYPIEVIIVDGPSNKESKEILYEVFKSIGEEDIKLIEMDKMRGYGHDIIFGVNSSKYPNIAWTHADMQTDIHDVFNIFNKHKAKLSTSIIKGKRRKRKLLDSILTLGMQFFVIMLLRVNIQDINAQPKIFSRSFFIKYISKHYPNDFSLDLYLLYMAKQNNYKIIEEAVNFNKRQYGEAKGGGGSIKNRIALIKRTFKYILKLREKIDHSK